MPVSSSISQPTHNPDRSAARSAFLPFLAPTTSSSVGTGCDRTCPCVQQSMRSRRLRSTAFSMPVSAGQLSQRFGRPGQRGDQFFSIQNSLLACSSTGPGRTSPPGLSVIQEQRHPRPQKNMQPVIALVSLRVSQTTFLWSSRDEVAPEAISALPSPPDKNPTAANATIPRPVTVGALLAQQVGGMKLQSAAASATASSAMALVVNPDSTEVIC